MEIRQILVPTDFSNFSEEAFGYASDLAQRLGARVHLLHVVEPAAAPLALAGIVPQAEIVERMETSAREALRSFVEKQENASCIEPLIAVGSPALEITRYAEGNRIDLIVTATHGRTGLAHLLVGSVAERIVRTAKCPVLVVPAKEIEPKG